MSLSITSHIDFDRDSKRGSEIITSVALDATFDFAKSTEDYGDVLALILRANQHEGRFAGMIVNDIASPLDACSQFITCRVGGRIVGCVRLTAVDGDRSKSPYAAAGHAIPDWIWNTGFVEAHSLAIDPTLQGAGLLVPIATRMACSAYASGYDLLLAGAALDLLSFYRHVGFQELERRGVTPRPGWSFNSALLLMNLPAIAHDPPRGRWTGLVAKALSTVERERSGTAAPRLMRCSASPRGRYSVPVPARPDQRMDCSGRAAS